MITQSRVQEVFKYEQGRLFWKKSISPHSKIGSEAGRTGPGGYTQIQVDGKRYYSHRLIFLYHHGYLPIFIDHKHGKSVGNYIWNLRPCTVSQNTSNAKIGKNNKSGVKGVSIKNNRFIAQITHNRKKYYLGSFENVEDARLVVEDKRKILHGSFANNG